MTFKEGDVVTKVTGGPMMTVEDTRTDNFVSVTWFDAMGEMHRDTLAPNVLQKWVRAVY